MTADHTPPSTPKGKTPATKLSVSVPEKMLHFIDEQCSAFNVGRSTYLQMLLEAEQHQPRKEFTKRARH